MATSSQQQTANLAANTPNLDPGSIGTVIGNVPFGQLLSSAAIAIAEAQTELDKGSLRVAEMFSGTMVLRDPKTMLPIDANRNIPHRTEAGVYYAKGDNGTETPFQPQTLDTRVSFGRNLDGTAIRLSMIELGFVPNFYQFIETLIEIKISITLSKALEGSDKSQGNVTTIDDRSTTITNQANHSYSGWWWRGNSSYQSSTTYNNVQTTTTPVDAAFSAKYNYAIEASSLVRTKLVPVPPPPILEQRIRQLMDIENKIFEHQLAQKAEGQKAEGQGSAKAK
jgi:hypothetical protein